MKQMDLADKAGISDGYLSLIISGLRRPSWHNAKALAKATGTTPELWLEGSPDEIRAAVEAAPDEPPIKITNRVRDLPFEVVIPLECSLPGCENFTGLEAPSGLWWAVCGSEALAFCSKRCAKKFVEGWKEAATCPN